MASVPTKLVILQPTPFCNIDCKYCYLATRSSTAKMSFDIAEQVYKQVFSSKHFDNITFVWHAGEPLVLPHAYYKRMFELCDKVGGNSSKTYHHNIQTNGILLNKEWIDLFEAFDVQIGLSLDGPQHIHDKYRVTRSGKGTHSKVLDGLKLLQDSDIEFGIIMVLTLYALNYPDEIFDFFVKQNIVDVSFNIEEIEGINENSTLEHTFAIDKYKRFMKRFLELTDRVPVPIKVREFTNTIPTIFAPIEQAEDSMIESTNNPLHILTVTHSGDFSTFCPELAGVQSQKYKNFNMGNVLNDRVDNLFDNPVFQLVNEEVQKGVQLCKDSCEYWRYCGGGSPGNKFFEHGRFDVTETMNCKLHRKTLVDTVIEHLENKLGIPQTT